MMNVKLLFAFAIVALVFTAGDCRAVIVDDVEMEKMIGEE